MAISFYCGIDWAGSGTFVDEGARVSSFASNRGKDYMYDESGIRQANAGACSLVLEDFDRRFDPFNLSSPLYPNIRPGRKIRVTVSEDGITKHAFVGTILDLKPQAEAQQVTLICKDDFFFLAKQDCDMTAVQTNVLVSDALAILLNQSGLDWTGGNEWIFPALLGVETYLGSATIPDNGDLIPYFWTDPEKSILSAVEEVAAAFAGNIYITADGSFAYFPRTAAEVPSLTIFEDQIGRSLQTSAPWDEIFNHIKITGSPRSLQALGDIWKLGDTPLLAPGQSITLWAEFDSNGEKCPAQNIVTPAATTDYLANAAADGSGANMTASLGLTFTAYGSEAKLILTNNHGSASLYVTLLKIRGQLLTAQKISVFIEDIDSIDTQGYGRRSYSVDNRWLQTAEAVQGHADYMAISLPKPKGSVFVTILDRFDLQWGLDLYNFVNLDIPSRSINGIYYVGYIEHSWEAGGGTISNIRFDPALSNFAGVWNFPARLGISTYLGW